MEHTIRLQGGEEATSQELQVLKGGPTKLSFERRSCQRPGKGGALGGVGGGPEPVAATWRQLCNSLFDRRTSIPLLTAKQGGARDVFPQEPNSSSSTFRKCQIGGFGGQFTGRVMGGK